jgi:hypothetical protein
MRAASFNIWSLSFTPCDQRETWSIMRTHLAGRQRRRHASSDLLCVITPALAFQLGKGKVPGPWYPAGQCGQWVLSFVQAASNESRCLQIVFEEIRNRFAIGTIQLYGPFKILFGFMGVACASEDASGFGAASANSA